MSARRITALISPALIFFICSAISPAQDVATGAIHGTVLDASGRRAAKASVVAVNIATSIRFFTSSDNEGRFAIESLPPGEYFVRAVADGMAAQITPQLHVDVGGAAEIEFRLAVAGAHEQVTVSAAPATVDTQATAVSTLLDERAIADLPLNGRRFSDLMLLSPGVTQDPRSLTSGSNGDLSFGGIRGFQNSFLVDGSDYNNGFFAQALGRYRAPYQFSTEVVQEFRVSSNGYGAEQGRAGGAVINVVTKSGSNHVHGTAFYDIRDSSLAASDAFVDDGVAPVEPPGGWPCNGINPDAGGHDRRPHQAQQDLFLRRIRSAYFSQCKRRRVFERHGTTDAAGGHRAVHSRRFRLHRSAVGMRLGATTELAGGRIPGGADRLFVVWQARHQCHPAQSTRVARQHHALLGHKQCFS